MKYIDAEKLKAIIRVQIKERKEWLKDPDKSDRQDQLWSDLNGEDMNSENLAEFARHFYELGINARKEE